MNRSALIAVFAERNGLSKKKAETLLSAIFDEMIGSLIQGERIEFRGFGSFFTKTYNPRRSRNPKSGETIWLQEKKRVRFRVSGQLLEKMNNSLM